MKILLVEDSFDIQLLLSVILKNLGYTVVTADNGQQAWDILQQQSDINLVVSDWLMPVMDGIELCRAIRQASWNSYIYFILITGMDEQDILKQVMEIKIDDFLVKPLNENELRVCLKAGQRVLGLEQKLVDCHKALADS